MTTYSDAAKEYARERGHMPCVASESFCDVLPAFDAGQAAAIAAMIAEPAPGPACVCGTYDLGVVHRSDGPCYAAALATVTPRTISTAAELDALPKGAEVLTPAGLHYTKGAGLLWRFEGSSIWHDSDDLVGVAALGPLTLLVPATAAPEPVRLLDPDDPRIKPGAVLQWHNIDEPFTVGGGVTNANAIRSTLRKEKSHSGLYLIAEAPADPDEPILAALRVNGFVADQLAALRAAGYDVVKQAL